MAIITNSISEMVPIKLIVMMALSAVAPPDRMAVSISATDKNELCGSYYMEIPFFFLINQHISTSINFFFCSDCFDCQSVKGKLLC